MGRAFSYWSTGDGDDTMITLWNAADEVQDLAFTLFFSGGQYKLPLHLEPRATRMFNVSEIIQSRVPDADGNVIPLAVHEGSAVVSGPRGRNEHILVGIESGTYNVRKATCGKYCITCDGIVDYFIEADPFAVAMGGTTQLSFTVQDNAGNQYDATSYSRWSSSNTSMATVSEGLVTAAAVGSFDVSAEDTQDVLSCNGCYYDPPDGCPCKQNHFVGEAPGTVMANVQISKTTVSPTSIGSSGQATITVQIYHDPTTGLSNPSVQCSVATYSTSPSGIMVTYHSTPQTVSLSGASPAIATFTVDSPSAAGTVTIQAALTMPSSGINIVAPAPPANGQTTLTTTD